MSRVPHNDADPFCGDAFFRQLCETAGVALIATDRDLNIRTWNSAAARMFGAAADRMIGTPVCSVIPKGRRANAEELIRRAIMTGSTFMIEFQHRDEDGHPRELAGNIAPVVSESGACLGSSLCIRDITKRINLQNEVNESRKMASLGALAGALSHHFNNILGGVITSVDYALASNIPSVTNRVLQQTGKALHRATALVNGLLAFAEGDHRTEDLSDFTEILYNVADDIDAMIEGRNIEFVLEIPRLPIIPTSRVQMQTALHNIARNAVEAMPNGGKLTVAVSLEGDRLVTRVCDTGVGMDESAISRAFEPFWSTKSTLSSSAGSAEGTGLGLAIAHGLVQTVGGSIAVSSEPHKGACFVVSIPVPGKA